MQMNSINEERPNSGATSNSRRASLGGIDIGHLEETFNKYATRKTYITGLFDLSLIVTNFTQLKQTIQKNEQLAKWNVIDIILTTFISISLTFQIVIIILLVFLAMQDQFIDKTKRDRLTRGNNLIVLLTVIVSIINIFINVFINI